MESGSKKQCKCCAGTGKVSSKFIGLLEAVTPDIKFGIGSMGTGLPAAVGFALAKKLKNEDGRVYCYISDGELAIGTTWESALIAYKHKLDNLVVIIDNNGLQAMGKVGDILPSFWPIGDVINVGGHDHEELKKVLSTRMTDEPTVINAVTVKGYPVDFMINNNLYHYKAPSKEEYEEAKKQLNG